VEGSIVLALDQLDGDAQITFEDAKIEDSSMDPDSILTIDPAIKSCSPP